MRVCGGGATHREAGLAGGAAAQPRLDLLACKAHRGDLLIRGRLPPQLLDEYLKVHVEHHLVAVRDEVRDL